MARFDVHRNPEGAGYVINCQSDLFSNYKVRVVVPLLPPTIAPKIVSRLNPVFEIEGHPMVMVPHFIASIPVTILGPMVLNLEKEELAIQGALDMLTSGF
jgi:toxin CcdB